MEKIYRKSDLDKRFKRTKIVTTIGPSTEKENQIEDLYKAGMTTVRLNFSHGDHAEHLARIDAVKDLRAKKGECISLMLDTKGPEIRVGKFKGGKQEFKAGETVTIYCDADSYANKECGKGEMTAAFNMAKILKPGDVVLIDDGKLEMPVQSVDAKKQIVVCKAFNDHIVSTNKRVNLPGVDFLSEVPFLAQRDKDDIKFGCEQKMDCIAASFTNSADNIKEIKSILKANGREDIQVYSKIESQVGIENFDSILASEEGVMIARGDLGLEIPYFDVPYYEQQIINKCREAGKPVIVATQMLDTMTDNPTPTRAEVTDVFAAVQWGADATMTSGETAAGTYPTLTIQTMTYIDKRAEIEFYEGPQYDKQLAMARATTKGAEADIANKLAELAKDGKYNFAIATDNDGKLLKTISKFRPNLCTLGVTSDERLWTAFGVWSGIFMNRVDNIDNVNAAALSTIAKNNGAKAGEKVLVIKNGDITELTVA